MRRGRSCSAALIKPASDCWPWTALRCLREGSLGRTCPRGRRRLTGRGVHLLARRYREAELKHGRVAMLACFGMITADANSLFPRVFTDYSNNPLAAVTQCPKLGWLQILTFIMFIEVLGIINSRRPDYEPGNFLGTSQWDMDEGWESYQTKELNNGRLAMFGAIGMLTGSYITGQGPLEVMTGGKTVIF